MYNTVFIPCRDRVDLLEDLLVDLLIQDECDEIYVMDNSDGKVSKVVKEWDLHLSIQTVPFTGASIYRMWNWALHTGQALSHIHQDVTVTLLNDDITIPYFFISTLASALSDDVWCVYPDYRLDHTHRPDFVNVTPTEGTYRHGGMCGWAFMLDAKRIKNPIPLIDEQFKFWCGDDELELQIRLNGGKVARVEGLGLSHVGSATALRYPELQEIGWADLERFREKYGDNA